MTKVRVLRIERDFTAKALAESLKIDDSILSLVERQKARASDRVRFKLSSFFGVPETELFSDDRLAI